MNAMILAAGKGTRLGALGAAVPKVLIEVGGRPLLAWHLDYLRQAGARRVVVNTHHHAEQVEAAVRDYDGSLAVVCVHEPELLGTAGAVRNALEQLGDGPFLILYGDIVVQDPLDGLIALHRERGAAATLVVHAADRAEGKGVVEVDADGMVQRFAEKEEREAGPALINSGIYAIGREVIEPLERGTFSDFGRDVFPALARDGAPLATFQFEHPVIDIGTPEGLALARANAAYGDMVGSGARGSEHSSPDT
jgi:NDP-sugar pyrophosphorylase family protein